MEVSCIMNRLKNNNEKIAIILSKHEKPSGRETKVAFLFNDLAGNRPGMMVFLDPTKHEKARFAVRAIESWYIREWTRAQSI